MALAIVTAVGSFWSWGIIHNFATESAKKRTNYTGGFYDLTQQEAESTPNWITLINMGFSLAGLGLLVMGVIFILRE